MLFQPSRDASGAVPVIARGARHYIVWLYVAETDATAAVGAFLRNGVADHLRHEARHPVKGHDVSKGSRMERVEMIEVIGDRRLLLKLYCQQEDVGGSKKGKLVFTVEYYLSYPTVRCRDSPSRRLCLHAQCEWSRALCKVAQCQSSLHGTTKTKVHPHASLQDKV